MIQIVAIKPKIGPSAGRSLITVMGANLRPQSPGNPFAPPAPPTMALMLGNRPATNVRVFSDTLLTAITPSSPPGRVDVRLDSLDAQGNTIDSTVLAQGFEFARPDLVPISPLHHLCEAIRSRFSDQILENTMLAQDVDYDGTPIDERGRIENAEIPGIAIVLRRLPLNTFERDQVPRRVPQPDGTVQVNRPTYVVNVEFDVHVFTDNDHHRFALSSAILANIERRRLLDVPSVVGDPSSAPISYDLDVIAGGDFRNSRQPNESNLRTMAAALIVRQFRIGEQLGFPNDLFAERTLPVLEILSRIAGETV